MNATTRSAYLIEIFTLDAQDHGTTPREEAYSFYSDFHKDEYGVRPGFAAEYSLEELVNSIISIEVYKDHEAQMKKEARKKFEKAKKEALTRRPFILGDFWPS